ncbi:MAG: divergent polysaccharide deacetylase family protein [Pseudomonadota bacterium]
MKFLGGVLLGLLILGGAVVYLSISNPIPVREEEEAVAEAEPAPSDSDPVAAISPEIAPSDTALPAPVPQPSSGVNRTVRSTLEEPTQPAEDGRFSAPEPFETTVSDGQLSGLPPAATLEGPAPIGDVPQVEGPAFELQGPALSINAVPFEARGDLPLVAVVLNDAGSSSLSVETLLSLSMPLTLGIVPRTEEDVDLAAEAKLADYEVLAQFPVATGEDDGGALLRSTMSDLEVAEQVETNMAKLWMSIGASASVVNDQEALDERIMTGVITVLERNGFAFLNVDPASVDQGRALAEAFTVAYAGQTSSLGADATSDDAYQALNTAAEQAQQSGAVIVSGPPTRAMLEGLLRWGLEQGGRSVQLAPLSAVIGRINQDS